MAKLCITDLMHEFWTPSLNAAVVDSHRELLQARAGQQKLPQTRALQSLQCACRASQYVCQNAHHCSRTGMSSMTGEVCSPAPVRKQAYRS